MPSRVESLSSPRALPARSARFVAALLTLLLASSAHAATNAESAQRAINFLSADAANWAAQFRCTSCHRHGATMFALSTARANGYDLDALTYNGRTNRQNLEAITARMQSEQRLDGSWIHEGNWYPYAKTSYSAFGLAGYDANVGTQYSDTLVRAADWALSTQVNGRWKEDFPFYPVGYGNVGTTARLMTAIAQAKQRVDPARAAQYQASLDQAAAYIVAHMNDLTDGPISDGQRYTHQMAWAIVGLKAAGPGANGQNTAAINTLASKLLATRALGDAPGWGGLAGEAPDEYATSITLYALCVAGRKPAADGRMAGALDWLKSRQGTNGSWGAGTRYPDIPTTFAAMGLACFGDYSVGVSVSGATRKPIEHDLPTTQTASYVLTVRNNGYKTDEYTLNTQGGLAGWTSSLDRTTLELGPDATATVTLTITAPAELEASLTSDVMVVAESNGADAVKGSARVTTYTTPPPPTEGVETTTTLLTPAAGQSLTVALDNKLSARVVDGQGWRARGPGMGVVTFTVAGVTVGADNDADGDGVYTVVWHPRTATWSELGTQDVRAVYSGVTLRPDLDNRLGSTDSRQVEVLPSPYSNPSVTLCGLPGFTEQPTLHVCGYTTTLAPGANIESAEFILHGQRYPVVPSANGGLVETELPLTDGANVIQLVGIDTFGGITTAEATVMVDSTPPELTIASPSEGAGLAVYSVDVHVVVRDWSPVRVETNLINVTDVPAGGGTVTHTVWLTPGGNVIQVRATDAVGHVTEKEVTVWVDAQAPFVGTGLPDGWLVGPQPGDTMGYSIGVYSASATRVTLSSGGTYTLPRGGGGVDASLHLVPGTNTFTIDVTGETGLTTSLTRTVRYDNSPPEAEMVVPVPGGTYSGLVTLTARVTDSLTGVRSVAYTRDGSGIRGATLQPDGTWTADLDTRELVDGAHTVEVWMTDDAGNFVIKSFPFSTKNR
ncbi:hypothetical protein JY651_41120 [Pyxidicoccus parkwayensis]|uniref:ABC transporter substrate-binding protein n=1 Tax=Pyxidicoccus parkwayensis TaxID=2813578 RepID=A0ABX7NRL6_9BACT|nr:Ig-like domain-containing protein [Pyxidicoccus parkwaysis]QSQ21522.1 hypothetical protein JY651_41120 [Pyxidicoccus parkwaysis]